ncbi:hypothetical protein [Pseudomonas sp. LB3P31]
MSLIRRMGWRRRTFLLAVVALLIAVAVRALSDEPEIALMLGEPWETMRQRSTATIAPALPGQSWFHIPKSDASLRFEDFQYGFVTPLARFFTVSFDSDGRVGSVRMSPQIEPLLLDDTLKVLLDLQDQWRQAGWTPIRLDDFPSFADTPEWRARLQNVNIGGTAYWRAEDKYQVLLGVNRFLDDKRPTEERYLITLQLATPWGRPGL